MRAKSLHEIFSSVSGDTNSIFVVPQIRADYKRSDYLYLLYKDLIENSDYTFTSLSALKHYKLLIAPLFQKAPILHYHWLEFHDFRSLCTMPWKVFCLIVFHVFGGKIIWTLHNKEPHDKNYRWLYTRLHPWMANIADKLLIHCPKAKEIMMPILKTDKDKYEWVPHPEFPAAFIEKDVAIQKLNEHFNCGISSEIPTLLMFGNISNYKKIDEVCELLPTLNHRVKLIIAGPVKKGNMKLFKKLNKLSESNQDIVLLPYFIKEAQVPWFYNAADICVFNYREILSSGGFHMADAYKKTIIAPALGCLTEQAHKDHVHLFHSVNELKDVLDHQLDKY